jgi:hypothetical protein
VYKVILLNAKHDPVNPKIYKDCSCGSKIVKYVRLGEDMRVINVCVQCDKQWMEGVEQDAE